MTNYQKKDQISMSVSVKMSHTFTCMNSKTTHFILNCGLLQLFTKCHGPSIYHLKNLFMLEVQVINVKLVPPA